MVEIFKVVNKVLELNHEYLRGIPAFEIILTRDNTPKKVVAYNELLFVHHWIGYGSPFSKLAVKERTNKSKVYSNLPLTWKPDRAVDNAILAYDEIQKAENPSEVLVQALKESLHMTALVIKELTAKLQENLQNIEILTKTTDVAPLKEDLLRDLSTILSMSDKLPKAFQNLDVLEQRVVKDRGQNRKARGDHEIGMYEDPPTANHN